jgi:hypothetical protein
MYTFSPHINVLIYVPSDQARFCIKGHQKIIERKETFAFVECYRIVLIRLRGQGSSPCVSTSVRISLPFFLRFFGLDCIPKFPMVSIGKEKLFCERCLALSSTLFSMVTYSFFSYFSVMQCDLYVQPFWGNVM